MGAAGGRVRVGDREGQARIMARGRLGDSVGVRVRAGSRWMGLGV